MSKEKQEIEFIIPNEIKENFIKGINSDISFKDVKFIKSKRMKGIKGNKYDDAIIVLKTSEDLNLESLKLGAKLQELKVNCTAKAQIEKVEKDSEKSIEPIKLRFERAISKEFRELFYDSLNIEKIVSIENGSYIDVYFDVSDIVGRSQLVKRIAQIMDAVTTVRTNKRSKQDSADIQKAIEQLEAHCNYMKKTQISLEKVTGKELINRGIATPFISESKKIGLFSQLFKLLSGKQLKQSVDYYFMNKLVEQDKDYVISNKIPKKLKEAEDINHAREILLHYEYGEQLASGNGIIEVENYFNTITKIHNEHISKTEQSNIE